MGSLRRLAAVSIACAVSACGADSATSVQTITTPSSVCSVSTSTRSVGVDAAAANGQLTIAINRECQWTATSDVDWIGLTPKSGQGDSAIAYSVSANVAVASRRGTISVNDFHIEVTQAAAPCKFSVSPDSASVESAGGQVTVSVTTQAGCSWGGTSQASWIAVMGDASTQTGNGTLTLRVDANGTTPRSGSVTIANQVVTISQEAARPNPVPTGPCPLTLSAAAQTVGAAALNGTVTVSGPAGCAWSAVSDSPWIAITAGSNGTGTGVVQYSVGANPTPSVRSGTIAIAGQIFTVMQEAATPAAPTAPTAPPCTFVLSATSHSAGANGGTNQIAVSASPPTCAWTASTTTPWLTLGAGASGTGNGTLTYVVAANAATTERIGTLTVAGTTVTVTQAGAAAPCTFALSEPGQSIAAAGASGTVTVTASAGSCAWAATGAPAWVTITSGATGTGNGTVRFTVAANPNTTARKAVLTVAGQAFEVSQAAAAAASCNFSLSAAGQSVPAAGASGTVTVTASAGSCAWTVTGAPGWVTITTGASGTGTGTVQFTIAANPNTTSRTAVLTVAGQAFEVSQAAAAAASCNFSLSATGESVPAAGASGTVTVTASAGSCAWAATGAPGWVNITGGATGTGTGTVRFTVAPNSGQMARNAMLTIAGHTFTVSQAAAAPPPCTFNVSATTQSVGANAGNGQIGVTASAPGCAWTASTATSWLSITPPANGTGNGTAKYAVVANSTPSARTGTLTVAGHTVSITQDARPITGKLSDKKGTCPNITFTLDDRTIRTNGATSFSVPCAQLKDKDKLAVTGTLQPDGSVVAATVRPD